MAVDDLLQGAGPGQQALDAVECQAGLQQVGVALLGAQVVVQHTLLQRRQGVDLLHVAGTTGHNRDDAVDGRLVQLDQAEHVRGDVGGVLGYAVGRHLGFLACPHHCRQRCHGGLGEQHTHVYGHACTAQAFDQGYSQQRVAAQLEEIVMPPYPFHAQHLGPYLSHRDFGRGKRRGEGGTGQARGVRVWQRPAVEFAMAGQRQFIQADEGLWHHVPRQAGLQGVAQQHRVKRLCLGVPGQQAPVAHQHHGLADAGLRIQGGFNFAQLHTHATDLDLVVIAAYVVQRAVRVPAYQVTRAV